jgi:FAD/FMN-containing dehydrogenase
MLISMNLSDELKAVITGEVENSEAVLETYSHDASLFEVVPETVVFPKDSADVQALVKYVAKNKKANPNLSITARRYF